MGKSRFTAAILALAFGSFGINNFYTRHISKGVWDCVLTVLFAWTIVAPIVVMILNLIRACQYLWCDTDVEFRKKYVNIPDNLLPSDM